MGDLCQVELSMRTSNRQGGVSSCLAALMSIREFESSVWMVSCRGLCGASLDVWLGKLDPELYTTALLESLLAEIGKDF